MSASKAKKARRSGNGFREERSTAAGAGSPGRPAPRWFDRPPSLDLPLLNAAWPFMLAVFVFVFAVYAWSASRTVVLEDDGEFVSVVYFHALAHAPGFPLFVLLAKPFAWLPIGSVAFRVHLASGFFGAAACAVFWWIVRCLVGRADVALVAAGALALSDVFWSQAIIADVYSLNALLFLLLLALALGYVATRRRQLLPVMALVFGLGLSNHWPLFLLALPCVACVLFPVRDQLWREGWPQFPSIAGLLMLGLLPYAEMVLRSRMAPALTFAGPIESLGNAWVYLSRAEYATVESSATAGLLDKLRFVGFLGQETLWQYSPLGAGLAVIGVCVQWRRWKGPTSLGLVAGFAGATLGSYSKADNEATRELIQLRGTAIHF